MQCAKSDTYRRDDRDLRLGFCGASVAGSRSGTGIDVASDTTVLPSERNLDAQLCGKPLRVSQTLKEERPERSATEYK